MRQDVILFGSGGLAKELISYMESEGRRRYNVMYCVSTQPFNNEDYANRYEVKAGVDMLHEWKSADFILAVADQHLRRKFVYDQFEIGNGHRFVTYIHPSALVSSRAIIGQGCVIAPQAIITSDAKLGDFVFMNTNATVGHDSYIGAFSTLHPNTEVCGNCEIGDGVELGIGSMVLPKKRLAAGIRVSAGSYVRHDFLTPGRTLQGNPAKERE